jgi:hypothetical protein
MHLGGHCNCRYIPCWGHTDWNRWTNQYHIWLTAKGFLHSVRLFVVPQLESTVCFSISGCARTRPSPQTRSADLVSVCDRQLRCIRAWLSRINRLRGSWLVPFCIQRDQFQLLLFHLLNTPLMLESFLFLSDHFFFHLLLCILLFLIKFYLFFLFGFFLLGFYLIFHHLCFLLMVFVLIVKLHFLLIFFFFS